ncbi:MAG: cyclic nucleotide-binding domain-containing protein [Proteobacteria bacterium]|nr:cyclic nucleotide-binding domain-containing protein [Pseudomonadota bacterium]
MNDELDFLALVRHETAVTALVAGQFLFQKGDAANAMYVVKSGELQIGDGNVIYETVRAGGIVGEMALVDALPRSASVKAISPCEVVAIDQRRFLFMIQQTPFFAIRVMRVLAQRLRAMNERLTQL